MGTFDITGDDIESWAGSAEAPLLLPELVRRLLLATADPSRLQFPSQGGTRLPGWDGILHAGSSGLYWPDGISFWELTCRKDAKTKLDEDFAKRVSELGAASGTRSYVAVSGRRFDIQSWIQEHAASNFREVRALGPDELAAWLCGAPAVMHWFRERLRLGAFRTLGTLLEQYERATNPPLPRDALLAGEARNLQAIQIRSWAAEPGARTLLIHAEDREEALAFVAAALSTDLDAAIWESRTVVVDSLSDLQALLRAGNSRQGLFLLDFDPEGRPIPGDVRLATFHAVRSQALSVAPVPWQALSDLLQTAGWEPASAARLAAESRGSLSAIRTALGRKPFYPWLHRCDADVLAALLLVGRFEALNPADVAFVNRILGREKFDIRSACEMMLADGAPISRSGNSWGFTVPKDAFRALAPRLTSTILSRFSDAAVDLLSQIDEKWLLPPEHRFAAAMFRKVPWPSDALREGVCTSLAYLSMHDPDLEPACGPRAGSRLASLVVRRVLREAKVEQWASLDRNLSTLAEAAPEPFLESLEDSLSSEGKAILQIFAFSTGLLGGGTPDVSLLWALEVLAWREEWLPRAARALASLSTAVATHRTQNPLNSLRWILDIRVPQTEASDETIRRTAESIAENSPEVAFDWACAELAGLGLGFFAGHACPTFGAPVPDFSKQGRLRQAGTQARLDSTLRIALQLAGEDGKRWAKLIDTGSYEDLLEPLEASQNIRDEECALWAALRSPCHAALRRDHVDEVLAKRWRDQYARFTPADPIERVAWLFSTRELPDFYEPDWKRSEDELSKRRREAIEQLHGAADGSLRKLLSKLAPLQCVRAICESSFIEPWLDEARRESDDEVYGALYPHVAAWLGGVRGIEWLRGELSALFAQQRFSRAKELALRSRHTKSLWDHIDALGEPLLGEYWRGVTQVFDAYLDDKKGDLERAIGMLLRVGNTHAAFETAAHARDIVDLRILFEATKALFKSATALPTTSDIGYLLHAVFQKFATNSDISDHELGPIAFTYVLLFHDAPSLPVIARFFEQNPEEFVGLLEFGRPASTRMPTSPSSSEPDEERDVEAIRATNIRRFLSQWRGSPGEDRETAEERSDVLLAWATKVLELAKASDLSEVAAMEVSSILARAPGEPNGIWPNRATRELLERPIGRDLSAYLEMVRVNARGGTSRPLGAGGRLERVLAASYRRQARLPELQRWPATQALLNRLATRYEHDADRRDERTREEARIEGFTPIGLVSLDVLVLMKLAAVDRRMRRAQTRLRIDVASIAKEIGVDEDEVTVSVGNLEKYLLLRRDGSMVPDRLRVRAFLLQLPTPYSVRTDQAKRGFGLRTGPSAPKLAEELVDGVHYVMEISRTSPLKDAVDGIVVQPIDPRMPEAAAGDADLYELVSLFDALRVLSSEGGHTRVIDFARAQIEVFFAPPNLRE